MHVVSWLVCEFLDAGDSAFLVCCFHVGQVAGGCFFAIPLGLLVVS